MQAVPWSSVLAGRRVEDLEVAAGKEDDERGRRRKRARGGRLARRPRDGCRLPVRWSNHGATTTASAPAGGLLLRPLPRPDGKKNWWRDAEPRASLRAWGRPWRGGERSREEATGNLRKASHDWGRVRGTERRAEIGITFHFLLSGYALAWGGEAIPGVAVSHNEGRATTRTLVAHLVVLLLFFLFKLKL
jgi:hypothetical protein